MVLHKIVARSSAAQDEEQVHAGIRLTAKSLVRRFAEEPQVRGRGRSGIGRDKNRVVRRRSSTKTLGKKRLDVSELGANPCLGVERHFAQKHEDWLIALE